MFHKKSIVTISVAILLILAGLFYFRYQVYYSHKSESNPVLFEIRKGQGNGEVATNLQRAGLVSGRVYFYYYLRSHGLLNKIFPGDYNLSPVMTIPEIAAIITEKRDDSIRVTFPEGFSSRKMAARLLDLGFSGDEFLEIAQNPGELVQKYDFLKNGGATSLEGYLFPDTYFFKKDEKAEDMISKMLNNFEGKLNRDFRSEIEKQGKAIKEVVIMASIIEREVMSERDMKLVGGVFANRLASEMPLQSDATLSFYFDDDKDQHEGGELDVDTPYNTYRYKGLPSGPIGNPGEKAIAAAINPQETEYMYFLTDKATKETVFSRTFEEHVAAKKAHGL